MNQSLFIVVLSLLFASQAYAQSRSDYGAILKPSHSNPYSRSQYRYNAASFNQFPSWHPKAATWNRPAQLATQSAVCDPFSSRRFRPDEFPGTVRITHIDGVPVGEYYARRGGARVANPVLSQEPSQKQVATNREDDPSPLDTVVSQADSGELKQGLKQKGKPAVDEGSKEPFLIDWGDEYAPEN